MDLKTIILFKAHFKRNYIDTKKNMTKKKKSNISFLSYSSLVFIWILWNFIVSLNYVQYNILKNVNSFIAISDAYINFKIKMFLFDIKKVSSKNLFIRVVIFPTTWKSVKALEHIPVISSLRYRHSEKMSKIYPSVRKITSPVIFFSLVTMIVLQK